MGNIMFFNIPAHGHTNPTLPVAEGLVAAGHRVRYYSYPEFRERIRDTGAEYISCEEYLPPAPKDLDKKVGRDFSSLVEMIADVTVRMEDRVREDIEAFRPDCIVSDSVCFQGKLFAGKYRIPLVCSTTTMAFNRYSARLMKKGPAELLCSLAGLPRIRSSIRLLQQHGYDIASLLSVLANNNDTDTIVYTSRTFQPMAETFSDRYAFVGPMLPAQAPPGISSHERESVRPGGRPLIYVSMGTVLNRNIRFYRECIRGLADPDWQVIMSVGPGTDLAALGEIPPSFSVRPYVDQPEVLSRADMFLTHCGMNSVSESLYYGVPMVLFPQHSEENAVALRTEQLGAGIRLKKARAGSIRQAVLTLLSDPSCRESAERIGRDFGNCGGVREACACIERVMRRYQ